MKTTVLQTVAFVLGVGLAAQTALGAVQEIVVTNATGDQQMPAVWQSKVVWEGQQGSAWVISVKDVADAQATAPRVASAATGENRSSSIWGNTIVWQWKSSPTKYWDIYGADISDPMSTTRFAVDQDKTDKQRPRVSDTSVVYEYLDQGYSGIRMRSVNDLSFEAWWTGVLTNHQYPAISADLVVSQYKEAGSWEIIAFDREDPNRMGWVCTGDNDQLRPAIYGNWVVWQDNYNGDWDIRGTKNDLLWFSPMAICEKSGSNATSPAIWNNVVVWQDDRNGNWDIYGYNLTTKKEFRITTNNKDQTNPAISFSPTLNKYVVVWQDNRNGNWDIYGALIDGADVAGSVSSLKWDVNADAVVDTQDVSEVQQHVGERNGISP
jgi:beta propeller repeat protein